MGTRSAAGVSPLRAWIRRGAVRGRMVIVVASVLAAATVIWMAWVALPSSTASSDTIPTATSFDGIPQVGAVFSDGADSGHDCTGSVLSAPGRDLVLTAAHCVSGSGAGAQFAPGYHDGVAPYGMWDVEAAYVDPRWVSSQDPQHDYAFLIVATQQRNGQTVHLSDVVPGNRLGLAPAPGRPVQVIAYPADVERPITCTTTTYVFSGYPAFDCRGFGDGTSGAPSLDLSAGSAVAVRGLIGGLNQGGCVDYTSYSPRFDQDTVAVYQRAVHGDTPDTLPVAGDDGC